MAVRPGARGVVTYVAGRDRFFDDAVAYLTSMSTLGLSLNVQAGDHRPYAPKDCIVLSGMPGITDEEWWFYPRAALDGLLRNEWPEWPKTIELVSRPLDHARIALGVLTSIRRLHDEMLEAAFTHYYESTRSLADANWGKVTDAWGSVWQFGRVVRNAFAHGGVVHFSRATASPVTWRGTTLSPTHNGQKVIGRLLGIVDVLTLMEEMDAAL